MRIAYVALGFMLLAYPAAEGQVVADHRILVLLERLFPAAETFAAKSGNPPVYKAFAAGASGGKPKLLGYAFWTTEVEPLERGYDGPIKMLVGMDTRGVLTGVIETEDHEPYGYFSVETPEFAAQFKGKSVRDRFAVGDDIDAITRATVSVTSASRAVRNSARRVARTYLRPAGN